MSFAEKLKAIRKARGMTQQEMADLLHTSKQVISRYENGLRSPKISAAQKYAILLNIPLRELLGDDAPVNENTISPAKQAYIDEVMSMSDEEVANLHKLLDLWRSTRK